jgi:uncharacterized protein DUF6600
MNRRNVLKFMAAAIVAVGIQAGSGSPSYAVTQISASFEFYDELSPYGRWERVSRYGDCWVPLDVPVGWRPYTVGYWVDTDYGWMWISQDPWGGLPYHYGRWTYDSHFGWLWVPDDDEIWAPAWVSWRYDDEFIGWAPLPPEAGWGGSGLSLSISVLDRSINRSAWCFTPIRTFGTTRVRSYIVPASRNVTLLASTRNVTRYEVYNSLPAERGLRPEIIERATGRRFQRYRVVDSRSQANLRRPEIQGSTIAVYRPRITGVRSQRAKFAPRGATRNSPAVMNRQRSEQRRFDQRMRQERSALEREHRRELQQNRQRMQADQMRQRQQAEMRAQREREAQERRAFDQRRRIVDESRRDEGQGRGQTRRRQNQDQGTGQGQPQDQGRGQSRQRQERGQSQDKAKGQDQGNSQDQRQDDQDKDRGRGHGRGGR